VSARRGGSAIVCHRRQFCSSDAAFPRLDQDCPWQYRRFNVDPGELLVLNGLLNVQTFYVGTVLQIPQTGKPYPGVRLQKIYPSTYTVLGSDETMYTIACQVGDVEPLAIAQANKLPVDPVLYVGQQLNIL
jgi:hypothetical protein